MARQQEGRKMTAICDIPLRCITGRDNEKQTKPVINKINCFVLVNLAKIFTFSYRKRKIYSVIYFPLKSTTWRLKFQPHISIVRKILLLTGRSGGRIPMAGGIFSAPVQTDPQAHSVSCTTGTWSFLVVKRPGCGVEQPPSSAEVKERVQLYPYSRSGPS